MTARARSRWLVAGVAFVLGGIADATLRPLVTPVELKAITVSPAQDGCEWDYSAGKYLFGSQILFGDGGGKMACKEVMDLTPTVRLVCECK